MKSFYNTGINELLVCIYEISGELVFKYGISGCSRWMTLVAIANPIPSQVHLRQLFPSHLKPIVTLYITIFKRFVKVVSILQCGPYMCCNWEQSNICLFNQRFHQDSEIDSGIGLALGPGPCQNPSSFPRLCFHVCGNAGQGSLGRCHLQGDTME